VRYQSRKGNWKKAVDSARDLVVAAGGDGTVAKVFTQIQGRDVPVAVLPIGTANNIARSLGLIGDARELVAGWDLDHPDPFDIGVARRVGGSKRRSFVETCGGGLFVSVIERGPQEVEQGGALVGGEIDRALTLFRGIVEEASPVHWDVEVDGMDLSGDYLAVEAMNIRLTGPGIPLAPDSDPGDGFLDIALVTAEDRSGLLEYIDRRLAHEEHAPPEVQVVRGSRAVIRADKAGIRIDDDLEKEGRSFELLVRPGSVRYVGGAKQN